MRHLMINLKALNLAALIMVIVFVVSETAYPFDKVKEIKNFSIEGISYQNVEEIFYDTIAQQEVFDLYYIETEGNFHDLADRLAKISGLCLGNDAYNFPVGTFAIWLIYEKKQPRSDEELRSIFSFFERLKGIDDRSEANFIELDKIDILSDSVDLKAIIRLSAALKKFVLQKRGYFTNLTDDIQMNHSHNEISQDPNIKTITCKFKDGIAYVNLIDKTLGASLWYGSPSALWPIQDGKLQGKKDWTFTARPPSESSISGGMSIEYGPVNVKKKYSPNNQKWNFQIQKSTDNDSLSSWSNDIFYTNIPFLGRLFHRKKVKCRYNLRLDQHPELIKFHSVDLSKPYETIMGK